MRKAQIASYRETELAQLDEDALRMQTLEPNMDHEGFKAHRRACIEEDCLQQEKNAVNALGNAFWHDDARISPLRGALATWNLTIDDLTFATFHGTSTVMNDKNETAIIQAQLEHLGRKKGNILFAITQKYLTGHSKGAAGAWMLNGALQALETGLIPGNRNADDIDPILRQYENILFPNRSIQTDDVKAFSITAFGFGQKGAQALVVHPRYCFATRSKEEFEAYVVKRRERQRRARKYFMDKMINGGMFMAKVAAPYSAQDTYSVLLDPTAKLGNDGGWQMQFGTQ
jgi:fatty acid synthase subunit alpha